MKIGIIHPTLDVIGGAEQTTLSLLKALNDTEHKVTLYTTTKNLQIPINIKIKNLKKSTFQIGWRLQRILEIKKLFKKAKNEDLLFVSSGNLVLSDTKKSVVIYCHSTFESELKNLKTKKSKMFAIYHNYIKNQLIQQIKLLEKPTVQLIANSDYTKNKIKKLFQKESNVIYPPVKIKEMNTKNSKKSGIVTIARYSPEKNLEFNLKVIKNLNVTYKIFGNTKFLSQINYYNHLQTITHNEKQIQLFCNTKRDFIENYLNSSKVYFQSSEETFGISVVEGIMSGCIPIVPDNTANNETVFLKELRYKENDENDAKEKIQSALNGNFDKYLEKLQKHVKKFSEENFQKKIIAYLSQVEKNNTDKTKQKNV